MRYDHEELHLTVGMTILIWLLLIGIPTLLSIVALLGVYLIFLRVTA